MRKFKLGRRLSSSVTKIGPLVFMILMSVIHSRDIQMTGIQTVIMRLMKYVVLKTANQPTLTVRGRGKAAGQRNIW